MKRFLLLPLLVLVTACGGTDATSDAPLPTSDPGAAGAACLAGDADCQDTGPDIGAPPPGQSDAVPGGEVPYDAATAPSFVTGRPELPSCGSYGVDGPRPLPQAVRDCFSLAVGSPEGAEYVVADRTIEGDVVVRYYRALPAGGVEVLLDATRDALGSARWEQIACTGYDAARGFATGCPPDGSGEV